MSILYAKSEEEILEEEEERNKECFEHKEEMGIEKTTKKKVKQARKKVIEIKERTIDHNQEKKDAKKEEEDSEKKKVDDPLNSEYEENAKSIQDLLSDIFPLGKSTKRSGWKEHDFMNFEWRNAWKRCVQCSARLVPYLLIYRKGEGEGDHNLPQTDFLKEQDFVFKIEEAGKEIFFLFVVTTQQFPFWKMLNLSSPKQIVERMSVRLPVVDSSKCIIFRGDSSNVKKKGQGCFFESFKKRLQTSLSVLTKTAKEEFCARKEASLHVQPSTSTFRAVGDLFQDPLDEPRLVKVLRSVGLYTENDLKVWAEVGVGELVVHLKGKISLREEGVLRLVAKRLLNA